MEKEETSMQEAKTGRKPAISSHRLKSLRRRLVLRKLRPSLKPKLKRFLQSRRLKPKCEKKLPLRSKRSRRSLTSNGCSCRGKHFASLYKYDIFQLDLHTFILGLDQTVQVQQRWRLRKGSRREINLCPEGSILILKKLVLVINPPSQYFQLRDLIPILKFI